MKRIVTVAGTLACALAILAHLGTDTVRPAVERGKVQEEQQSPTGGSSELVAADSGWARHELPVADAAATGNSCLAHPESAATSSDEPPVGDCCSS